jgi:putative redox protein
MTTEIIYNGQLRTSATHLRSGNTIINDAPIDNHGKGEAFSPTDIVATALGTCILTIMGIAAQKNDIDLTDAKAEVTKVMASAPRRIAKIEVIIKMPPKNYSDQEKQILKRALDNCPVCQSLHPDMEQDIQIVW